MARSHRYSVYDMMEDKGVFDGNPANAQSSKYTGPIPYPKMFYHPKGETRVTQTAEVISRPDGIHRVGEQRELIYRSVENAEEEQALRLLGWHDHPAKAIAASGKEPPPISSQGRIEDLESQIRRLTAELAQAKIQPKPKAATAA